MGQKTLVTKVSTLIAWGTILVLAQLLITQWTVRAAGNREVIDYISFAGTVVGMILAVLAIVYSYLSNASQKDDSVALRTQIDSLNDTIGKAQASSSQFSDQLQRLDEIRQGIATAAENSAAALEASGRLEGALAEMKDTLQKPFDATSQAGSVDFEKDAAIKFFVSKATPRQSIFYYLAVHQENDGYEEEKDRFFSMFEDENYKNIFFQTRREGEIQGYYWMFYDLNAVKETHNKILVMRELLNRIDAYTDDSYVRATNPDALKRAVNAVKARIIERLGTG